MAPSNKAAWLNSPEAHPMIVDTAEYPVVGDNEIIVKVSAVALNPMDWMIQVLGDKLFAWLQYPYCGGTDVAGTVAEVGSGVTKFKVGDRVMGLAGGFTAREGAFQEYTVLLTNVTTPIPEDLSFDDAVVLPLALSTSASALYQKNHLALEYPKTNLVPTGKTLLIWAGASSVGTNAIQLAVASGYEVFTTASPKNFEYCKAIGASRVFDYRSPTIVQDLVEAFKGKTCAGGFSIQPGAEQVVFDIIAQVQGSKTVVVASPLPDNIPDGIQASMVWGGSLRDNEVGGKVFDDYLPEALAQNKYQCLPKPFVVGEGLEKIREAMDKGKEGGISGRKLIVRL